MMENMHILVDERGEICGKYKKAHLFNVDLPEKGVKLRESDYTIPGNEVCPPVQTPAGRVGMGIVSFPS